MEIVAIKDIPKAEDVPLDNLMDIYKVCQKMENLCSKENGAGLSAVQVGIPWRLFIIGADNSSKFDPPNKFGYFVNCEYEGIGDKAITSIEGCLSLKDEFNEFRRFKLQRYEDIQFRGFRLKVGKELQLVEVDDTISAYQQGIVFQHEVDHQRDILISDIGEEVLIWY